MVLLVGCAYPQEHFVEDYIEVFCAWDEACGGPHYDTEQSCIDVLGREGALRVDECEYDSVASRACLSALRDLPCSEPWPQTCLDAFVCPGNQESP